MMQHYLWTLTLSLCVVLFLLPAEVYMQPNPCSGTYTQYNITYRVSQQATFGANLNSADAAGGCLISSPTYTTLTSSLIAGKWTVLIEGYYLDVNSRQIYRQQVLYINPAGTELEEVFCGCINPAGDCCSREFGKNAEVVNTYGVLSTTSSSSYFIFNDTFCYDTENAGVYTCLCLFDATVLTGVVDCPPVNTTSTTSSTSSPTASGGSSASAAPAVRTFSPVVAIATVFNAIVCEFAL